MKYLCLAYGNEREWSRLDKREQDELLAQDDVLRHRGDVVAAVASTATTVRAWDGTPTTTSETFARANAPLAGFSIIEAADLREAVQLVADTPCARAKGAVELRPIDQINDRGLHPADLLAVPGNEATESTPRIGPEHRRLDPFVGTWKVTGENAGAAPMSPNTNVTGEESYEWLTGGFFLVGRWDRHFDGNRHTGTSIIRYDPSADEYSAYSVDNLGFARTYRLTEREGVWSFAGPWERATIKFSNRGNAMEIHWEKTKDGSTWEPLCDLQATKGR